MGHGLIAWIIIGVVAGWLTGKIMKGSGFGQVPRKAGLAEAVGDEEEWQEKTRRIL
jgi:hypothetical protein